MHQLQAAKQHYKKGLISITINLRNLRQNKQHKDLFNIQINGDGELSLKRIY